MTTDSLKALQDEFLALARDRTIPPDEPPALQSIIEQWALDKAELVYKIQCANYVPPITDFLKK